MADLKKAKGIPFAKMSGSGNDFILVDDRKGVLAGLDDAELARRVCHRHTGVGADGLIIIEKSDRADFGWRFFNSDGSRADMCGNGGRCAARFARLEGIAGDRMRFETGAGIISAAVAGPVVKIQLTAPKGFEDNIVLVDEGREYTVAFIDTGVPHVVILMGRVEGVDVARVGRSIRNHPRFHPAGTNVNFAAVTGRGSLRLRTYETMACGTGSVAGVLVAWRKGLVDEVVAVETSGGEVLTVHVEPGLTPDSPAVHLEGRTIFVCRGIIDPEAFA
jgi:diaminopimelate epimerase